MLHIRKSPFLIAIHNSYPTGQGKSFAVRCDRFGRPSQGSEGRCSMRRFPARLTFSPRCGVWLVLALTALCPACSGGRRKVTGKVLYDGKPIKNAAVSFHPTGGDSVSALRPTGLTDENGVFTLITQNEDGAPAGEYRVTVLWLEEAADLPAKPTGF